MRLRRGFLLHTSCVLVAGVLALALVSCGPPVSGKKTQALDVKECGLPEDQKDSLVARWEKIDSTHSVRLAFKRGDFTQDEQKKITSAAAKWNLFFMSNYRLKVFDYGLDSSPYQIDFPDSSSCSQSLVDSSGAMTSAVGIYKQKTRTSGAATSQVVATTGICAYRKLATNKLPYFFYSSISVNWIDFFSAGKPDMNLHYTVLHELGHLLGLGHSCKLGSTDATQSILCSALPEGHEYLSAVMYPTTTDSTNEDLKKNDVSRASCVAGDPI